MNRQILTPATDTGHKSEGVHKASYATTQMTGVSQADELIKDIRWEGPHDLYGEVEVRTGSTPGDQPANSRRFRRASPHKTSRPGRPRVALVLSGGAARASSHIGVLEVLWDVLQPECVVGSSSGALMGLLAVLGYSPQEMVGMVRRDLYSKPLSPIPGGKYLNMLRLLRGGHLGRRLQRYCPSSLRLESLSPRLVIQCADLVSEKTVLLDAGPAAELVVASCSLPFLGKSYIHGDMVLMDACLMRNESAQLHKLLDVDLVVAIQTAWPKRPWPRPKTKLSTPRTVARCWEVLASQWSETTARYDLVIAPTVPGGFADMSPRRVDQMVELGRDAAREKLPQVMALLAERAPVASGLKNSY